MAKPQPRGHDRPSVDNYRLTCADNEARGKQFLRPSNFPTWLTAPAAVGSPPGLGPLPPPPFEQSPRSLGEVAAHFQEFWEVLSGDIIVLANTSEHGRLVFPPQNRGIVIYVAGIVLRATLR